MSAEKCGDTVYYFVYEHEDRPIVIVSAKAHKMVQLIQKVYPDWKPKREESEVWIKARSMGLLDEEYDETE